MFPEDSVVDFVAAYDVWEDDWVAIDVVVIAVEIFDMAQTITALVLFVRREISIVQMLRSHRV